MKDDDRVVVLRLCDSPIKAAVIYEGDFFLREVEISWLEFMLINESMPLQWIHEVEKALDKYKFSSVEDAREEVILVIRKEEYVRIKNSNNRDRRHIIVNCPRYA